MPAKKPQTNDHFDLRLTSPHMSDERRGGNQIHRAQQALHANKYGSFYKPNHNDGIYGPETAAATKHAKYALGFPGKQVNQNFDDALCVRLSGERPLGVAYALRRKNRRKPKQAPVKSKAADLALKDVGYRESGTNITKYGAWYGFQGAWCAMSVTYWNVNAGDKQVFVRGQRFSYVPNIYAAALHGDYGMSFTSHPEKGDLALFHFSGGEYPASHVGIVLSENPWRFISGNFGDAVAISTADRGSVVKFVRLPN